MLGSVFKSSKICALRRPTLEIRFGTSSFSLLLSLDLGRLQKAAADMPVFAHTWKIHIYPFSKPRQKLNSFLWAQRGAVLYCSTAQNTPAMNNYSGRFSLHIAQPTRYRAGGQYRGQTLTFTETE